MEIRHNNYFLTIRSKTKTICRRKPFSDFSLAIEACADHYEPKAPGSVLQFNTDIVQGKFARAYAELNLSEHLENYQDQIGELRYRNAVKTENSFKYNDSYFFLIESDFGIQDTENFNDDE